MEVMPTEASEIVNGNRVTYHIETEFLARDLPKLSTPGTSRGSAGNQTLQPFFPATNSDGLLRVERASQLLYHRSVPKTLTRKQLESRKEKAARFVRDVLGDPDRADEIEDESLEDYAARRKFRIVGKNPQGAEAMPTKEELMQRVKELEDENDDLQDQLDQVADIVAPPDEDQDDSGDNGDDAGGDDDPGEG
ncbi:MAG: hypothetical protein ACREHV_12190 [Rhizomicrobium sp.]